MQPLMPYAVSFVSFLFSSTALSIWNLLLYLSFTLLFSLILVCFHIILGKKNPKTNIDYILRIASTYTDFLIGNLKFPEYNFPLIASENRRVTNELI